MSGGGTRSVYGAGVLVALAEQYGIREPDLLIAESGSALSAMYYLARQYGRLVAGWLNSPKTPGFISSLKRPKINLDTLINKILKPEFPLDKKKLDAAKTELFIPLTRLTDGRVRYCRYAPNQDPYRLLHAAMALPIFYGKSVRVGKKQYVDGGFGANFEDHVRYAVKKGATHIIAVESSHGPGRMMRAVYRRAGKTWEREGHHGLARAAQYELAAHPFFTPPAPIQMTLIVPSQKLPVSVGTKGKTRLRTAFNLGYADAANNKELATLLKDL